MQYIDIIRNGRVVELSAAVFGKTLINGSDTYADFLDDNEEVELVQRLISDDKPEEWLGWMREYRKHYPLGNKAVSMLIENLQSESAEKALIEEFDRYSYTEEHAVKICRKALSAEAGKYKKLIAAICTDVRIFSDSLPLMLLRLDERDKDEEVAPKYAETYQRSLRKYRQDSNLERFYEAQKASA